MGLTAPMESLPSWTRTLNEEDACWLLDAARPGMAVADWSQQGFDQLPQASLPRRRELIRIVRDELLDHAAGTVADSAFLRLFHSGSPHLRRGLLHGRLLGRRPLVRAALDELIHPALTAADRPLAPLDADLITSDVWDRFLRAQLRPDIPAEAFAKTRSTVQKALADVEVLTLAGGHRRVTRVVHGRPEPLALAWLVAHELVASNVREVAETWALRESFAARLFAPTVEYTASCIEAGVLSGLLRRGYLPGQSRLQLGAEMG